MERKELRENKTLILLLFTGAVYFFLKYICPLTAPVLVAALLVWVCVPLFDKIREKVRLPRVLLMGLFLIFIIIMLGSLLWFLVAQCAGCIPGWLHNLDDVETKLCLFLQNCCNGLEMRFGIRAEEMEYVILNRVNLFIENFELNVVPRMLDNSLFYAKYALSVGAFAGVMIIAVLLLVKDYDKLTEGVHSGKESLWILRVFHQVIHYIVVFLRAQIIILLAISVLCAVVLTVTGIDNSVMFGVLAGFLDMLPFIGTGIVLIPLSIWQLVNGWYLKAGVCLLLYGGCVLLRELLEPKLIGEKVGIYPVAILLSVYAGVKLFGAWGILKGPLGLVIIYHGMKEWTKNSSNA